MLYVMDEDGNSMEKNSEKKSADKHKGFDWALLEKFYRRVATPL